jgi:hypothetical protein
MRTFCKLFVIFLSLFLFAVSCTRPGDIMPQPNGNDTAINPVDTLKIDSISTWSLVVAGQNCDPFSPYRIDQRYKFSYDTAGTITGLRISSDIHSTLPYVYSFRYDNQGRIETIVSQKMPYDPNTYDSLSFHYPPGDDPFVTNYIFRLGIETTLVKYLTHQSGDTTSIKITGTRAPAGITSTWFRANLISDTTGNIRSITYFRSYTFPATDTAMTVNYTYYNTVPNPYYTIFKKIKVPVFFLLSFGDLYGNYSSVDLPQFVSKNCFHTVDRKIYNNIPCVGTPGITARQFEYDLSNFYTLSGNKVISMRDVDPAGYNITFSGFANAQASFYY